MAHGWGAASPHCRSPESGPLLRPPGQAWHNDQGRPTLGIWQHQAVQTRRAGTARAGTARQRTGQGHGQTRARRFCSAPTCSDQQAAGGAAASGAPSPRPAVAAPRSKFFPTEHPQLPLGTCAAKKKQAPCPKRRQRVLCPMWGPAGPNQRSSSSQQQAVKQAAAVSLCSLLLLAKHQATRAPTPRALQGYSAA